jgi:hypothetical protein
MSCGKLNAFSQAFAGEKIRIQGSEVFEAELGDFVRDRVLVAVKILFHSDSGFKYSF